VSDALFDAWLDRLEERHLADLTFHEVSRALRALSSTYVERRRRLAEGAALSGAGKRAAFALFYAPLHYLLVRELAALLPGGVPRGLSIVDLGCGTGASSAAWARRQTSAIRILGVDHSAWAVGEASRTYRDFKLEGHARKADLMTFRWPRGPASFLAAFTMNELSDDRRETVLTQLIDRARAGDQVLIVEPLAKAAAPWWSKWTSRGVQIGAVANEWRFRVELPPLVAKLDRATGLDHRELTARTLWFKGGGGSR